MKFGLLNFHEKAILIIGNGQQAHIKGAMFEKEGARVYYVVPDLTEPNDRDLIDSDRSDASPSDYAIFVQGTGHPPAFIRKLKALPEFDHAFLVYACTKDQELNHQIVLAANEKGCLSANVHHDPDASFHACAQSSFGPVKAAVSTGGTYPAFGRVLLSEWEADFNAFHRRKLEAAGRLRKKILKLHQAPSDRRDLLHALSLSSLPELLFYEMALQKKQAFICIFHGSPQVEVYQTIHKFISANSPEGFPVWFAYLNESAAVSYNKNNPSERVCTLNCLTQILQMLGLSHIFYQPMLVEEGYCYEQIRQMIPNGNASPCKSSILPLLLRKETISRLLNSFQKRENVLLAIHPSRTKGFYHLLSEAASEHKAHFFPWEAGSALPDIPAGTTVLMASCFMLMGSHARKELFSSCGAAKQLEDSGIHFIPWACCLLEWPEFPAIFRERIHSCLPNMPS